MDRANGAVVRASKRTSGHNAGEHFSPMTNVSSRELVQGRAAGAERYCCARLSKQSQQDNELKTYVDHRGQLISARVDLQYGRRFSESSNSDLQNATGA